MVKKLTKEQAQAKLNRSDIEILEYRNAKDITARFTCCGIEITGSLFAMQKRSFCNKCNKHKLYLTLEEATRRIHRTDVEILEYESSMKVKVKHRPCGHVVTTRMERLKDGDVCGKCLREVDKWDRFNLQHKADQMGLNLDILDFINKDQIKIKCRVNPQHEYESNLTALIRGKFPGCRYCHVEAGHYTRNWAYTEEEINLICDEKGFDVLGIRRESGVDRIKVKCRAKGHITDKQLGCLRGDRSDGCLICARENMRGENHPNYNPYLTEEERQKRDYIQENKKWSKSVLEKDGFTCQLCGDNKGGNLQAHHLYSYADYPDLRLAIDNGVCLCKPCHMDFHNQYGYGLNTLEQFTEYCINTNIDRKSA